MSSTLNLIQDAMGVNIAPHSGNQASGPATYLTTFRTWTSDTSATGGGRANFVAQCATANALNATVIRTALTWPSEMAQSDWLAIVDDMAAIVQAHNLYAYLEIQVMDHAVALGMPAYDQHVHITGTQAQVNAGADLSGRAAQKFAQRNILVACDMNNELLNNIGTFDNGATQALPHQWAYNYLKSMAGLANIPLTNSLSIANNQWGTTQTACMRNPAYVGLNGPWADFFEFHFYGDNTTDVDMSSLLTYLNSQNVGPANGFPLWDVVIGEHGTDGGLVATSGGQIARNGTLVSKVTEAGDITLPAVQTSILNHQYKGFDTGYGGKPAIARILWAAWPNSTDSQPVNVGGSTVIPTDYGAADQTGTMRSGISTPFLAQTRRGTPYSSGGGTTPTAPAVSVKVTPTVPTINVALVGVGTAWSGSPFSIVGTSPASIASQTVTDATHAALVLTMNGAKMALLQDAQGNIFAVSASLGGASAPLYIGLAI